MSEGELLQMAKARSLDITEELYYDVIRQKTASLIASCCAVGAAAAQEDPEVVAKMKEFGLNVGMAFQIKDDLFDYGTSEIGKPLGIDIKEKKMTLPLIHTLQKATSTEKRRIKRIVKSNNQNQKKIQEVIDFVKSTGGIEYAQSVMHTYYDKSKDILAEFPKSDYKVSLSQLVQYTIERSK